MVSASAPEETPLPDEAIQQLADLIAAKLGANTVFMGDVASLAAQSSMKTLVESQERKQRELETYAASLHNGEAQKSTPAERRQLPKNNDEWRDEFLYLIYSFFQNPVKNVGEIVDVVQKIRHPGVDPSAFKSLTLEHIRALAQAKPDEFAFVAQQVIPDPMMEMYPASMVQAFQRGFNSMQEASRWARELVRQEYQAARRGSGGSGASTPTPSLPSDTEPPAPVGAGKPTPTPKKPAAVAAQIPKRRDWKELL